MQKYRILIYLLSHPILAKAHDKTYPQVTFLYNTLHVVVIVNLISIITSLYSSTWGKGNHVSMDYKYLTSDSRIFICQSCRCCHIKDDRWSIFKVKRFFCNVVIYYH